MRVSGRLEKVQVMSKNSTFLRNREVHKKDQPDRIGLFLVHFAAHVSNV